MKLIRTLTLNEAAKRLREAGLSISNVTLADGLEQGVYPFGLCISSDGEESERKRRVFQIYGRLLEEWIAERAEDE